MGNREPGGGVTGPRVVGLRVWLVLSVAVAVGAFPSALPGQDGGAKGREPVFVGAQTCSTCHAGREQGDQYSRWRASKHARAFAALARLQARRVAELSGVPEEPSRSPICLTCHATATDTEEWEREVTFQFADGLQCETCHGPGSEHVADYTTGPVLGPPAKMKFPGPESCLSCHQEKGSHVAVLGSPPLDIKAALKAIAHPRPKGAPWPRPVSPLEAVTGQEAALRPARNPALRPARNPALRPALRLARRLARSPARRPTAPGPTAEKPAYKTPLNLALSPDGKELYVAGEASGTVVVIDTSTRTKVAEIPTGGQPNDVTFSPDGRRAYATNRLDDSLSVIDTARREVLRTVPVGDEPHGVLTDAEGRFIYVLDTSADQISVLDARTFEEVKRLAASRNPWSLALSPDGRRLLVTNNLSRFVPFRTPPMSEVTVIDTARAVVVDRRVMSATNLLQGVAWHPSGRFALVTMNRTKNLVPMTRLLQGWTITNGLGIIWADGRVDQVLLDEPQMSFPDVADVAFTPDGRYALATSSGSDRLAVIDVEKLVSILTQASDYEREHVLPNHLGKPTEFIVAHIPTGVSPRGVVVDAQGRYAYVANALDDTVTVVDLRSLSVAQTIDLGGARIITKVRQGERLFYSANITFHKQFSCSSCHPDGHVDGLAYDIEPDGIGVAPVDNRTLRGILDTAPFKWEGTNPSLKRQCGPRLAVFFTRIDPFSPKQLDALVAYISRLTRPPNRYRGIGEELTPAQRRGKALFRRTVTNDGQPIPEGNSCISCHTPPYFTDRRKHDVGTRMPLDRVGEFDTPHLNNIYDSAPYLHNGIAATLEEIWTRYNPRDQHGVTNDMTKDQLNDLIEYLKTL